MDAMEPESGKLDDNENEGLATEESGSAPISVAPTLKRDQYSGSYNAKKAKMIDIPMV